MADYGRLSTLVVDKERTLTEKALKVNEEAGELAEAVLGYTKTSGNTYKAAMTKEDVKKEAADVIVTAASVFMDINGGTLDGLDEIIGEKMDKWQKNFKR